MEKLKSHFDAGRRMQLNIPFLSLHKIKITESNFEHDKLAEQKQ